MIRDKDDGKIIEDEGVFLHYEFDSYGSLIRSMKGVKLSKGMDTAVTKFYYNENHQLIKQKEEQGNLSYTTIYEYESNLPKRLIKIDNNKTPEDTLYNRKLESRKQGGSLIINTLNNSGKPYLKEIKEFRNDTLIGQHISHVFNLSFTEKKYIYEAGVLLKYIYISHFDKRKEAFWEYAYEKELIQEAQLFEEGERRKRRVFIYDKNNLPTSVVERDYKEKSIRIYSFLYSYQ